MRHSDKKNIRLNELDSLRGISILLVALFHYTTKFSEIFDTEITTSLINVKYGGLGVQLFFIISGFVIFMSVNKKISALNFALKRFLRLYPTFWICLLITFCFTSFAGIDRLERTFEDLVYNFTMLPAMFGAERIDGVYWSLIPELFFYLMIGFLILFKQLKNINWICIFWLILIIINSFFENKFLRIFFNLEFGYLFIIGIYFYKIKFEKKNKFHHLIIFSSLITSFFTTNSFYEILILFSFILVFYLFSFNLLKWIKIPFLIYTGKVSYAFYLIHQFIGFIIIDLLIDNHILNPLILIISPLIICLSIAHLVTFYFDSRVTNLLKKTFKI